MLDKWGTAYLTGEFKEPVWFGSTKLVSSGGEDAFVAKLDAAGRVVWAQSAGSTAMDRGEGVAFDATGNVYLTGWIGGDAAFGATVLHGGGGYVAPFTATFFLAKLDSAGAFVWVRSSSTPSGSLSRSVVVDGLGNPIIAGVFVGDLDLGTKLQTAGGNDFFLAKFDPSGQLLWSVAGGGSQDDVAQGVAIDEKGRAHVAGFVNSSSVRVGSVLKTVTPGPFVATVSELGSPGWVATVGHGSFYSPVSVAVDPLGAIAVVGTIKGKSTLGAQTFMPAGPTDVFVERLDADGQVAWATTAGGPGADPGGAVAMDAGGNTYITGSVGGTVSFGSITVATTPGTQNDVFVAKYDPDGKILWVVTGGGDGLDCGHCLAVSPKGEVFVAGGYNSKNASFGGQTISSQGSFDIFAWKFVPPDP